MQKSSPLRIMTLLMIGCIILVWYFLPQLASTGNGPMPQTRSELHQIAFVSNRFYLEYGYWPTGFASFFPAGNVEHKTFVAAGITNDGWKHPFVYYPFDANLGYGRVVSLGRDGKIGGEGLNRDIE